MDLLLKFIWIIKNNFEKKLKILKNLRIKINLKKNDYFSNKLFNKNKL